jgi:response regulator of citrate/malate metabolism
MKKEIKRNRKVGKGFDIEKLTKIWNVLAENNDWLHVAEISRRTNINECTIRWYLDRYLKNAIDEEKIVPTIRLRMVKLKPNIDLNSYVKALKFIKEIKSKDSKEKQN